MKLIKNKSLLLTFSASAILLPIGLIVSCSSQNDVDQKKANPSQSKCQLKKLGLAKFIDDSWNDINKEFIFKNRNLLLTNTKFFTSPDDLIDNSITLVDNEDPATATLKFSLKPGKAVNESLEPTTNETDFEILVTEFTNIFEKAKEIATQVINSTKFLDNLKPPDKYKKQPSEFDVNNLFRQPEFVNFGFQTQIEDNNQDDNKKGTKSIKVTLSRSLKQTQSFDLIIDDFLTDEEKIFETTVGGSSSFVKADWNASFATNINDSSLKIDDLIKDENLLRKNLNLESIIFKDDFEQKDKLKIKFKKINYKKQLDLITGINAQIYLEHLEPDTNVEWRSQIYNLDIHGFDEVEKINSKNLQDWANVLNTANLYLNQNAQSILASSVKSKEELFKLLNPNYHYVSVWNKKIIQVDFLNLLDGSQNDELGSLKAKFKFSSFENKDLSIEKVVTLYGFKHN